LGNIKQNIEYAGQAFGNFLVRFGTNKSFSEIFVSYFLEKYKENIVNKDKQKTFFINVLKNILIYNTKKNYNLKK